MQSRTLERTLAGMATWLATGTALNATTSPHWYARGWDFPRLLTLLLAGGTAGAWGRWVWRGRRRDWTLLGAMAAVAGFQLWRIAPYTPLARRRVRRTKRAEGSRRVRLVISNVLITNESHDRWLRVVREADPDVIMALEPGRDWMAAIGELRRDYPHGHVIPQENAYGMVLLSRLPLHGLQQRCIVEDDIPSLHGELELRDGTRVWLHCIHPRPPEPLRNQGAEPRDAELVLLAREIAKAPDLPRIVAGDLNDVAWSYTTRLFLRLSSMLDPRQGRGLYSTFNANYPYPLRWPLDHVFVSRHFRLVDLRLLEHVGSDHFPVLIELACERDAVHEQPAEPADSDDHEQADDIVERAPDACGELPPVA